MPAPVKKAILTYALRRAIRFFPCRLRLNLTPPIIMAARATTFSAFFTDLLTCPFLVYFISQSLQVGNMQRRPNQICVYLLEYQSHTCQITAGISIRINSRVPAFFSLVPRSTASCIPHCFLQCILSISCPFELCLLLDLCKSNVAVDHWFDEFQCHIDHILRGQNNG